MKIRSYRCPKCGREYNFADGNKTRLCRVCGCELDSLTVYSTDDGSTASDQTAETKRENREAEEQEALLCGRSTNPPHSRSCGFYIIFQTRASVVSHMAPRSGGRE